MIKENNQNNTYHNPRFDVLLFILANILHHDFDEDHQGMDQVDVRR